MNRKGLMAALALAALVGIVFGLYPELDLAMASWFYVPAKQGFLLNKHPTFEFIRDAAMWAVTALVVPPFAALAIKLILPRTRLMMSARAVVFLIATMILVPGLVANVILKDHWGRPRPSEVPQFGGPNAFVAWWDPRGACDKNCSFVSGDGSGAFWTLAPAALAPPAWRPLAYASALAFGAGVGVLRMTFGGHFFSDVAFAGIFAFLEIWLVHGLIYRWRATRLTDRGVEAAIERIAMPGYRLWQSLAARLADWFRRPRASHEDSRT